MSSGITKPIKPDSPDIETRFRLLLAENDALTRELKKKQQMLEHFRQAVDNSPNAIFSINRKGHITTWNPSCSTLFDYGESIVGDHFSKLLSDHEQVRFIEEEVLNRGEEISLSNLDLLYRCRNGEMREMVSRIYPVTNPQGIVHGFIFANTDLTERNQTQRELERYRHHLEDLVKERTAKLQEEVRRRREAQLGLQASYDVLVTILDGLDLAIRVVSLGEGDTIFANSRLRELEEKGSAIRRGYQLFQPIAEDAPIVDMLSAEKVVAQKSNQLTSFDAVLGRWFLMQSRVVDWVNGRPVRLQVAADITERKQIDIERQRMEKLESLGVLAGGIAHDFNNLLTGVIGNLSLIKFQAETGVVDVRLVENAVKASTRATSLTQQLLTFSKGGDPVRSVIDLRDLLQESVSFSLRGSAVIGEVDVAAELSLVEADEGQLSHVFHNLVINAKQAMKDGGLLRVLAENRHLTENQIADLPAGKYVRIDFIDNGPGIPPELLDKVYDPYFSTKEDGEGLGLAMVHTIVSKHQGKITLIPNTDQGVTFSIYLPASGKSTAGASSLTEPPLTRSGGRILLMDDEESIREVGSAMLTHLGYRVIAVANGQEALRSFDEQQPGETFDAVILDLTIPGGMGGEEVASRLGVIDPGVRIIASSGYSDSPVLSNYRSYGFHGVLKKPYRLEEMGAVLERIVNG